jgi:hypothetical protein
VGTARHAGDGSAALTESGVGVRPNKGMKLTKLSAAWLPEWTCRLMPALAYGMDAGTASQLIPGVRWTVEGAWILAAVQHSVC